MLLIWSPSETATVSVGFDIVPGMETSGRVVLPEGLVQTFHVTLAEDVVYLRTSAGVLVQFTIRNDRGQLVVARNEHAPFVDPEQRLVHYNIRLLPGRYKAELQSLDWKTTVHFDVGEDGTRLVRAYLR